MHIAAIKLKTETSNSELAQFLLSQQQIGVTDKLMIAGALLRLETVLKGLPAEDQKDPVRLLVREISVKHFDPDKDREPKENGAVQHHPN